MSYPTYEDPVTAMILAVLCSKNPDKRVVISRKDFKIPKGLELRVQSDNEKAWVTLIPKRS